MFLHRLYLTLVGILTWFPYQLAIVFGLTACIPAHTFNNLKCTSIASLSIQNQTSSQIIHFFYYKKEFPFLFQWETQYFFCMHMRAVKQPFPNIVGLLCYWLYCITGTRGIFKKPPHYLIALFIAMRSSYNWFSEM